MKKMEAAFPDQLYFVTAKANTPEIVLNANKVSAYTAATIKSNILTETDKIKKSILQYCSEQTKLAWTLTNKKFSASERNMPESIHLFLNKLLKSEEHSVSISENLTRLVESYTRDLVHGVSRGKIVT